MKNLLMWPEVPLACTNTNTSLLLSINSVPGTELPGCDPMPYSPHYPPFAKGQPEALKVEKSLAQGTRVYVTSQSLLLKAIILTYISKIRSFFKKKKSLLHLILALEIPGWRWEDREKPWGWAEGQRKAFGPKKVRNAFWPSSFCLLPMGDMLPSGELGTFSQETLVLVSVLTPPLPNYMPLG